MAVLTRQGVAFSNFEGKPAQPQAAADRRGTRSWPRRAATSTSCSRRSTSSRARCATRCHGARLVEDTEPSSSTRCASRPRTCAASAASCMLACGTSWHAALVGKFMIEQLARMPVEVDYGSEFRYRDPIVGPDTLAVVITQSGETADTLAALREAKAKGARSMAICNVVGTHGDARGRRHGLHPRRARDRRRLDQGVHHAARRRCTSSRSTWRRCAARSTRRQSREHIEALAQLPR